MKTLGLALTATITSTCTAAYAGSAGKEIPADPVVEISQAAAPAALGQGGDWTGPYAGFQLGFGEVETSGSATETGDDLLYGGHIGYNLDYGQFVLGGELDFDFSDIELTGTAGSLDSVARAKVKAGYDLGPTLIYGTAGLASASATLGDDTGSFYGVGVAYQFTPDWTVGGEVLAHQFEDFDGSGVDLDVNTVSVRASYNF